jgi:hypothetical protein
LFSITERDRLRALLISAARADERVATQALLAEIGQVDAALAARLGPTVRALADPESAGTESAGTELASTELASTRLTGRNGGRQVRH